MTRDDASAAVLKELRRRGIGGVDGIASIDSATIEKPYGWVFFYNSRRFVETRELVHALIGHGPVVVIASTGEVIELGSAVPAGVAISELEQQRGLGVRDA